jgi:TP53 regulating kinase and related kinases
MDNMNSPKELLRKGAEASLYTTTWQNRRVILKNRLPKAYRHEKLDKQIRYYRTIHEAQLIHEAKKAGVPTPKIYEVDIASSSIIMEYIEGQQVKALLSSISKTERERICQKIGVLIGKLHKVGIIHGDLTTSNMILESTGRIVLVDFGLGEKSEEIEAKGVDLHLMKRALQSTHYQNAEDCFAKVITGYSKILGAEDTKDILDKINEVEKRGRYVAERKQK